jgi:CRP-like cAMP-binding protein
MLHKHPVFCRAILKLEATRLRIVLTAIAQYSTQPLEHRLANRLLMLISSFGNETLEGMVINLHLSQHTLSQLIGATRQMVNLILKRWSKQEIIQHQYGTITVTNLSRLKELASD